MIYLLQKWSWNDGNETGGILFTFILCFPIRYQIIKWDMEGCKIEFEDPPLKGNIRFMIIFLFLGCWLHLLPNKLINFDKSPRGCKSIECIGIHIFKKPLLDKIRVDNFINQL